MYKKLIKFGNIVHCIASSIPTLSLQNIHSYNTRITMCLKLRLGKIKITLLV